MTLDSPVQLALGINTKRYLADALIIELRVDDLWTRRIIPSYHPSPSPVEVPGFQTFGAGRETKPKGTIDVLEFRLEPLYELNIPRLLVALDEPSYDAFRIELGTERRLEHLDRLLGMRADARVFVPAYNGYGNTQEPTMRRANNVSSAEAKVALDLADRAQVWRLPT